MPKQWNRNVGLALGLLLVGCASKSAPNGVTTPSSENRSQKNQLLEIQIEERGSNPLIVIKATKPMSPNVFKLNDPFRLVIDLTDTSLASVSGPIRVDKGGITEILLEQFDESQNSLSRISVGLSEPREYKIDAEGNEIRLEVGTASSLGATDLALPPLPPVSESVPESTETPAPMDTASAPAPATELIDVHYAASEAGTMVTLVGNGPVENYEDFLLENPQRVVIDLKGLKNSYAGGKTLDLGTPEINKIRLGKSKDKIRVVLDSKGKEKPAYTIERDGNSLVLHVAAVQAEATPPVDVAQAPAVIESASTEVPSMVEPVSQPLPTESVSRPVVITGLGFKQLQSENKSRLIITMSDPQAEYSNYEVSPGKIAIQFKNARVDKNLLKRPINTAEFKTAITSVTPNADRKNKTATIAIHLEQAAPYTVTQEGSNLYVDVNIPDQILRAQTQAAAQGDSTLPAPPADVAAETSSLESMKDETREAEVTVAKPSSMKKDYRYVQEGFMSDSSSTGEPLSDMAAIMAGDYKGKRFSGRKISLDFKDADIRSIFRLIADISKLNLIISDDVAGRVTVRLENVPWDQAFAIILQTKGLWFEKYGNIVRIASAEKLRAERELSAAAAKAAQSAKPLDVLFKPVSYATASDMIKQVKSVLTDRGTVDIDSRTNTLIIKDIRESLEKAKQMVEILDTQTPQVSIEARIVEANTNYTRSFGIIWGGQARFSPQTGNPSGVFFPNSADVVGGARGLGTSFSGLPVALNYPSPLGTNAAVGLKLGSINNILDLDLALGILETQGHAKLISSPKVTVLDNKSANINTGSKIPFVTQTANAGSSVRFESATTSLSVTPHVTNDGAVSMMINATRNAPNFAQLVQGNPLVEQNTASTEVLVKSGNTTVLGGVYSIRTGGTRDSLPYISNIPVIGWLFKNYAKELNRKELLIFVTPRIVGDDRESVRDIRN